MTTPTIPAVDPAAPTAAQALLPASVALPTHAAVRVAELRTLLQHIRLAQLTTAGAVERYVIQLAADLESTIVVPLPVVVRVDAENGQATLICPHPRCGAVGSIHEEDRAGRWNTAHEAEATPDGRLRWIQWGLGDSNGFEHERHFCDRCLRPVTIDETVEHGYL